MFINNNWYLSKINNLFQLDEPESTANTMKRSISSILGQMNQVLNPSPDDSDTEAIMIIEDSETVTLTKLQVRKVVQISFYRFIKNFYYVAESYIHFTKK